VPMDDRWRIDLSAISSADAERALCLWVNTPGNPAGGLDDLGSAAAWGRAHRVPVISDECYAEYTWDGPPRTILSAGSSGVLALHSLSKRSNLAGLRTGFYAGDPTLMEFLLEIRKHIGLMTPGPVLAAAVVALSDQTHVDEQRARYASRLARLREILLSIGVDAPMPGGAFYLWAPAPDGDDWALVERLAVSGGLLTSPGEFYGDAGRGYVRLAAVAPIEQLELVAARLS
jgi:aspartate/methionine/tyrosine aminotransferase